MKASACVVLALLASFIMGCGSENYLIHDRVEEVEVVVEVPVYIEVEIPTDPEDAEVWVDSFTQPTSVNGIDILWIIDTSGSMHDDEPALLAGIAAMMAALPESGWRLAMASNSPPEATNESQFPLVPGDDIVDAENMYNGMIVGHHEKGLDATYAYIVMNSYSNTWMRNDAALLVVFVSDEDDQSNNTFSEPNWYPDFVNWYSSLRASVFLASIVHVDPSESLCNSSAYNHGDRYIDVTNHFVGVVVDICSEDWAPGVTDASVQVEPMEEWPLSYIPVIPTIRVFIDTQLNSDWTYDIVGNKVVFTVIPPGGALVEIGYIIDTTPGDDDDSGN